MKNKFKDIFITSVVISTISLITFYIFYNIYDSSDKEEIVLTQNIKKQDTSVVDGNKFRKEIKALKKELNNLKNEDSITKEKESEKRLKLNNNIISYVSKVQKYLYSTNSKDKVVLDKYLKKTKDYYKIPNLSDNANFLLKGTINTLINEIESVEIEVPIPKKKDNDSITN